MFIPLSLLQKCFSVPLPFSKISEACDKIGVEIENISFDRKIKFQNVVTALVTNVVPHPNADKLQIASVSDGTDHYTVVCGAANCRSGLRVAFAKPGAVLHVNEGPWTIKKSKIRGIESEGMLCSSEELSLTDGPSPGIIELPENVLLGEDYAFLIGDPLIEIALTPNLGHCCSLLGLAREMTQVVGGQIVRPDFLPKLDSEIEIRSEIATGDQEYCPVYLTAEVENLHTKKSPEELVSLLSHLRIKPVNLAVDVTNLVMMTMGQPMHAFDASRVNISSLKVSSLKEPETVTLLNGKKVTLRPGTLAVSDDSGIKAVGGIMGTADSAVSESTSSIVLESAFFPKEKIRPTENYLQIHTDASYRFSRGTDPEGVLEAMRTALALLQKYAPEIRITSLCFKANKPLSPKTVVLKRSKVNVLLSCDLSDRELASILKSLSFEIVSIKEDLLEIKIPAYRHDIVEDIDLVEEVSRKIGLLRKPHSFQGMMNHSPQYTIKKQLKTELIAQGLREFYTCDLLKQGEKNLITDVFENKDTVFIETSNGSISMRSSLLPGLLRAVAFNIHRESLSFRCFEIGRTYKNRNGEYLETETFAIVITGTSQQTQWQHKEKRVDFYDLKGLLESVFLRFSLTIDFEPSSHNEFHPYRQADLIYGKKHIGKIGSVHQTLLDNLGIKQPVFAAECLIEPFLNSLKKIVKMNTISTFPSSSRNVTLSIKSGYPAQKLVKFSIRQKSPWLEDVSITDVYHDPVLGRDWCNITLKMVYRSSTSNLSSEEIEEEHQRIVLGIENKLKADGALRTADEL